MLQHAAGNYKGYRLAVIEPIGGMAVFYIASPGPDPSVLWGCRRSWSQAMTDGRKKLVEEANRNESSTRGRS